MKGRTRTVTEIEEAPSEGILFVPLDEQPQNECERALNLWAKTHQGSVIGRIASEMSHMERKVQSACMFRLQEQEGVELTDVYVV